MNNGVLVMSWLFFGFFLFLVFIITHCYRRSLRMRKKYPGIHRHLDELRDRIRATEYEIENYESRLILFDESALMEIERGFLQGPVKRF